MSDLTRKLAIFCCLLFTSFCFWKAGIGLIGISGTEILPSAQAALSPSVPPQVVVTTPIQQMRPGMRVIGRNPIRIQTESTIDPTPEGWRLVSVRMRKPDGTYFEAELLRPLSWISRHRAQPGAVIELNMPELHVVGTAEVLSVSACPPIDPGDGPVVLSTFKNTANNVLNIYVEGETDPIGVTAGHPIWSEDRQAFVHSDQLQPGERLRSALGKTVRITSIEIRAGPEAVYNLEVAGEHVYSVTNSGLLVHNVSDCDLVTKIGLPDGSYTDLNAPARVANTTPEAYAGVRQASQYLREADVPRHIRKQVLESFDRQAMRVRVAGEAEFGIRYFDNINAWPKGRYLFEQFPATRNSLALPPNWNQMAHFKQFQIRSGTTILEGPAARQGFYSGGQIQKYILSLDDLFDP